MNLKRFAAGVPALIGASLVAACGSSAPDLTGYWVTESMRDGLECQMGRVMVINEDKVVFGIAGQAIRTFEGLETEVRDDGIIVMSSGTAKFEFAPGEQEGTMTLISGPTVADHHTSRMPKDLARC